MKTILKIEAVVTNDDGSEITKDQKEKIHDDLFLILNSGRITGMIGIQRLSEERFIEIESERNTDETTL